MGSTYVRQSSTEIVTGEVINASDFNDEFTQLVSAFAADTGHSHDGTTAEGGDVTKLLGTAITIGDGTAGTDIAVTFDGETNDGVLTWMEDEDHFKFSDDVVIDGTKKLYVNDEGGEYVSGDGTDLTVTSGGAINLTATTDVVIPANVGVTFGTGEKIEGDSTDLTVTSGADINLTATSDVNIPANVGVTFGNDGEKIEGDGTSLTISSSAVATIDATTNIVLDADGGTITFSDAGVSLGTITSSGFTGNVVGNVTGNTSGTAATVTTAAQGNITSLGTLTDIELGATDTTITRTSAGDISVEGNIVYRAGGTDVPVTDGGTGVSTFTDGGILLGSGTGAITAMAVLADGEIIVGDGTTDPVAESGATARTSLGAAALGANSDITSITGLTTDLTVAQGGTGAGTFTDGGILLGSGTGAITAMAVLASGEMIVGDGTTDPGAVSLSGDVTINSSGVVTIAATSVEGSMLNTNVISGQTALTSGLALTDELLVSDAGTLKRMDISLVTNIASADATALAIALG